VLVAFVLLPRAVLGFGLDCQIGIAMVLGKNTDGEAPPSQPEPMSGQPDISNDNLDQTS
jgi:hypothetical protein